MTRKKKDDNVSNDRVFVSYHKSKFHEVYYRMYIHKDITVITTLNMVEKDFRITSDKDWFSNNVNFIDDIPKDKYKEQEDAAVNFLKTMTPF